MDGIKDLISVIPKYIPDHLRWLLEIIKNPSFLISDHVKLCIFALINLSIGLTLQSRWNTFQGDLTTNIITLLAIWGVFILIFGLFLRLFGSKITWKRAFSSGLQNISFIYLITNIAALMFYVFQSKIYDTKIFFLLLEFILMIWYFPASLGKKFLTGLYLI